MTFHVRYNDCHLEADMEREGATEGRVNRDQGRGRRGEESGTIRGGKWLGSPLVLTSQLDPNTALRSFLRTQGHT